MGIKKNEALRKLNNSVQKWYKNSWKEFDHLKNVDAKFYASDYYDVNVNKYGVKCDTSLRFWENKDWINKIDPYGWFQLYFRYLLVRRSKDDKRQFNRWTKIGAIALSYPPFLLMILVQNFMLIKNHIETWI